MVNNGHYELLVDKLRRDSVDRLTYDSNSIELICEKVTDGRTFKRIYNAFRRPYLFKVESCFIAAVRGGSLLVVKMLHDPRYIRSWTQMAGKEGTQILRVAINGGRLDVFEYLVDNGHTIDMTDLHWTFSQTVPVDDMVALFRRILGNPDFIRGAAVAARAHLTLRYSIVRDAFTLAHQISSYELFEWLRDKELRPWVASTDSFISADEAFQFGTLDYFEYVQQHYKKADNDPPPDLKARQEMAASRMTLDKFQWAVARGNETALRLLDSQTMVKHAVINGNIEIVRWMYDHACQFNHGVKDAITGQQCTRIPLDVLEFLRTRWGNNSKEIDTLCRRLKILAMMPNMANSWSTPESVNRLADPQWVDVLDKCDTPFGYQYLQFAAFNLPLDRFVERCDAVEPTVLKLVPPTPIMSLMANRGLICHLNWMLDNLGRFMCHNSSIYKKCIGAAVQSHQVAIVKMLYESTGQMQYSDVSGSTRVLQGYVLTLPYSEHPQCLSSLILLSESMANELPLSMLNICMDKDTTSKDREFQIPKFLTFDGPKESIGGVFGLDFKNLELTE
eukprot:gene19397-23222_t